MSSETSLIVLTAAAGWLAAALLPAGLIRLVLTLPLVLVLPGYALLSLVHRPLLEGLEGVCFAVGVSLAAVIATGFLLNMAGGFSPLGWATALAAISAIAAITAANIASRKATPIARSVLSLPQMRWPSSQRTRMRMAMVLAAMATAYAAGSLAVYGVSAFREFKYSELWVVPEGAGHQNSVLVGLRNMEGLPSSYEVELLFDGKLLAKWQQVALGDGEQWVTRSAVPPHQATMGRAEVRLYKSGDPVRLYRQVWLNMSSN